MDNTHIIKLGGVPEHFNLPIHLAIQDGDFEKRGITLEWTTFKGGTGQMTKALRDGEVDACILLTEGIIADIIKGNPSRIVSEYVTSPLTWGIHTGFHNPLQHYSEIFDRRYAISRFGSGSHLIPLVDAHQNGKFINKDQYVVINNLDGAIESLMGFETDVFYWEKFTTKPLVDKGMLRRIGEFKVPWPSFVIAVRNETLEKYPDSIVRMLRIIHDKCDFFMQDDTVPSLVFKRYGIDEEDAMNWYHSTSWAIHGWVSEKMLKNVIFHLKSAQIIDDTVPTNKLVWVRNS